MNREEILKLNNIIDRLVSSNKQLLEEADKKFGAAQIALHNFEAETSREQKRIESKLDVYCQQLYRNSFYGGIQWRWLKITEWFKRKSLLRQKPVLKKLEVQQDA